MGLQEPRLFVFNVDTAPMRFRKRLYKNHRRGKCNLTLSLYQRDYVPCGRKTWNDLEQACVWTADSFARGDRIPSMPKQ